MPLRLGSRTDQDYEFLKGSCFRVDDRDYRGRGSDDKHRPIRALQFLDEPRYGVSYGGGSRSPYSDAMHPGSSGTVDQQCAEGHHRRKTVPLHGSGNAVCLWRDDTDSKPRSGQGYGLIINRTKGRKLCQSILHREYM